MDTKTTTRRTKDPKAFKAIAINDPHFAASSPPAFKTSYLEHLESNLDQVFRKAIEWDVDAILWAGDMFHLKEPRHNPLWLIARVAGKLANVATVGNLLNLGIGGNHDYKHGSLAGGLKGSPLEILTEAQQLTLLDDHEFVFQTEDTTVRVAGGSYHHGQAQHVRDKKKDGAEHLITLGHFWLGTQTGEFFGEALYGFDFFKESESDIIVVGHHHEDKGVMEAHGKLFVSQGSISITGAHPHDLKRRPAAVYIEITGKERTTKLLRPKMQPIEELIDLERHEQIKKERKDVQDFIETLAKAELKTADPNEILAEIAPTEEIKRRAHEYIELAENK